MTRYVFLIGGALIVAALQYRYWFGDSGHFAQRELDAEVEKAQRQNDQLTERNRMLAAEVRALKTGLDAVEARARTDLGMIGEDETFYVVVDEAPAPAAAAAPRADEAHDR